jgi:hypothetical protein
MASVLEFAKSTLAKALGPQGPALSFTIGETETRQDFDSLFTLHKGTKKVRPFKKCLQNLGRPKPCQCIYI